MTYDIALYPRTPGQSWADVVAADEQDGPSVDEAALEAGVATFRRIEARLREHLTEPVEVWVAEETDGDVFGELTASESGLQVELYDRSASVSFPVHPREDRAHFLDQVRRAVRIVAIETGYEAYDPQTGRSFDGLIEEEGLSPDDLASPAAPATVTAGETTGGPGATGAAGVGAGAGAAALQQMDPRMLRRRAILYIVLGAILAVFAFLRFAEGDTGWFAWLIAGFAAFNLIAGVMLRGLSKQAEARAAAADGTADPTTDGPTTP